ncbi:MAG: hypothetical protein PHE88_03015 [Elusimicrobia bacterium]|nr:hypothetical protein [Elusimicrobiota bacterium]
MQKNIILSWIVCILTWQQLVISADKIVKEVSSKDKTAGWKTYRNTEYRIEIKYPPNWNCGENILRGEPNMEFCPPELGDTNGGCKCPDNGKHMSSTLAPILLFAFKPEFFLGKKLDEKGVWKDKRGNVIYQLRLFNDSHNDSFQKIYDQMIPTFKFIGAYSKQNDKTITFKETKKIIKKEQKK